MPSGTGPTTERTRHAVAPSEIAARTGIKHNNIYTLLCRRQHDDRS